MTRIRFSQVAQVPDHAGLSRLGSLQTGSYPDSGEDGPHVVDSKPV